MEDAGAVGRRGLGTIYARRFGSDARGREKYKAFGPGDQAALVAVLGTLRAPPDAPQLSDPSITKLSRK